MRFSQSAILIAFLFPFFTKAQDAEGCKDHPLFTRLSHFQISECQENYNSLDLQIGPQDKKQTEEGNVTTIRYAFNAEGGAKQPSPLQIIKNYENAILQKGGKKMYSGPDDEGGGPMSATFHIATADKEYWVTVFKMYEGLVTGEVDAFSLVVLEKEPMKQDVEASELFKELSKQGTVSLYINFESAKAAIQAESQKIIDQVAQMMNDNPTLNISIEGHTDNAGTAASNQLLSENRAKAVMNAIIAKGIDKTRLRFKGWGQSKPVSDNNTEEGKAKNRRVEIVKL